MNSPQNRTPKFGAVPRDREIRQGGNREPSGREIRQGGNPESFETQTISWHFHQIDQDHDLWGWGKLRASDWKSILAELKSLETMTWAKLKEACGGRSHGTNHHSLPIEKFCKRARERLSENHLNEYEEIFSLRLSNTLRLYGIRDGRVLRIIWHDPYHGSDNGAYPTKK